MTSPENELEAARKRIAQLESELHSVYSSKAWAVGIRAQTAAKLLLNRVPQSARIYRAVKRKAVELPVVVRKLDQSNPWWFPSADAPLPKAPKQFRELFRAIDEAFQSPIPERVAKVAQAIDKLDRNNDDILYHRRVTNLVRDALVELESACYLVSVLAANESLVSSVEFPAKSQADLASARSTLTRVFLVDVRCLQHVNFANRGVGRMARNVLEVMAASGVATYLLIDSTTDPLPLDVVKLEMPEVRFVDLDHACDQLGITDFVNVSPVTAVAPVAILKRHDVIKTAVVHDFIQLHYPAFYLRDLGERLRFAARYFSYVGYNNFLANSNSTKSELASRFDLRDVNVAVTGVGQFEVYKSNPEEFKPHASGVVVIALPIGGDPRKNPLVPIRALKNAALTYSEVIIKTLGTVPIAMQAAMRKEAVGVTGGQIRLEFHDQMTDDNIIDVLRHADLCIVASYDEGFSLPVVESIAQGCPVVASSIPAHEELVGKGQYLCDPANPDSIWSAIQYVLSNRSEVVKSQTDNVVGLADPQSVKHRIGTALLIEHAMKTRDKVSLSEKQKNVEHVRLRQLNVDKYSVGNGKPRIAVVTPWPPQRSGIADFSKATLTSLAELAEVTVLTNRRGLRSSGKVKVEELSVDKYLGGEFDVVLSVLGNSQFHVPALEYLEAFGGPVLAHDTRMIDMYSAWRGDVETARLMSTPEKYVSAADVVEYAGDVDSSPSRAYGQIGRLSSKIIVHSKKLMQTLANEVDAPLAYLPFVPYRNFKGESLTPDDLIRARSKLGIEGDKLSLATFGYVDQRSKGENFVVGALRTLVDEGQDPVLHFVGHCLPEQRVVIEKLADSIGVRDRLKFVGYVDESTMSDYLLGIDVAIQLRMNPAMTISGAYADCAAFGLPCVITAPMEDELIPLSYIRKVDQSFSVQDIANAIQELAQVRTSEFDVIEKERQELLRTRGPAAYAQGLLSIL